MAKDYTKALQLPTGTNQLENDISGEALEGKNWTILDGKDLAKRPGLRPVFQLGDPDVRPIGPVTLNPTLKLPDGVLASCLYVVGNQHRNISWLRYPTIDVFNGTQLVYIYDGHLYSVRKIPVMNLLRSTSTWGYSFQIDNSGDMAFTLRDYTTGNVYTSTSSTNTTIGDLITSMNTLLAAGGSIARLSSMGQDSFLHNVAGTDGLLIGSIAQSSGTPFFSMDATYDFVYGYVPIKAPLSAPTDDYATSFATRYYRAFYTSDKSVQQGQIQACQFQEEMLFAGQRDALFSYDGYRLSVAGCVSPSSVSAVDAGAGAIAAGTYNYIIRPKIRKPSGQITYGPVQTTSVTIGAGRNITVSTVMPSYDTTQMSGGNYANVALAPRRYNPRVVTETTATTTLKLRKLPGFVDRKILPGEYITTKPNGVGGTGQRARVVTVSDDGLGNEVVFTNSGSFALNAGDVVTLGETCEIYRTAASGTLYYLVAEIPLGTSYTDSMVDATLITKASYVAKTYIIQQPPDFVVAVTQHQNRVVCIGEYHTSYDDPQPATLSMTSNVSALPFIKTLWWTAPNSEEFSPTYSAILDVTTGEDLNSVFSFNDQLYVGGRGSLWIVSGNLASASTFTVTRVPGATGTVGNTAITALNGQVLAVSDVGLYALSGSGVDYSIGQLINPLIRTVRPELLKFVRLTARNDGTLLLTLPGMVLQRPATSTTSTVAPESYIATENAAETVMLVYYPHTDVWSLWDGQELYAGGGTVEFDGNTWVLPRKSGRPVCVLDKNWGYDNNTAVKMQIKGPWQHEGNVFTDKTWARLRVLSVNGDRQNFLLSTKIEQNWEENVTVQSFNMDFRNGRGYGETAYGTLPYGDGVETQKTTALTNQKALSVRTVFENQDPAERPRISAWALEVAENRKNMKQE